MVQLGFIFWILLFVKTEAEMDLFRPKTIRIYQFKGICPGHENASIRYSDIQLINMNRTFHISMKVHIRRFLKNGLKLRLFLSRCTSRETLDSCETYNTIKVNHFCGILNAENKPWTEFVKLFTPPMSCPLKKGLYQAKNGTFDGSTLSRFPVLDWYWKVMVNLLDEVTDELLLCATLEDEDWAKRSRMIILEMRRKLRRIKLQSVWQLDIFLPSVLRIYKFTGTCQGYEKSKAYYSGIKYSLKNREYYISMTLNVTEDTGNDLKLELNLVRCTSRDSLDTCEDFQKIKINNFCNVLNKANTPWATYMKKVKPPITCPYKKGIYVAENVNFDGSNVVFFAISPKWFWKVTAKIVDKVTGELVLCTYIEGQVV